MLGHVAARPFFFDDALNARAAPSTSAVALRRIFYAAFLCSPFMQLFVFALQRRSICNSAIIKGYAWCGNYLL